MRDSLHSREVCRAYMLECRSVCNVHACERAVRSDLLVGDLCNERRQIEPRGRSLVCWRSSASRGSHARLGDGLEFLLASELRDFYNDSKHGNRFS